MGQEHITVATGSFKTRAVKTRYPVDFGLTAGTTKQEGTDTHLEPEKSLIKERDKTGL